MPPASPTHLRTDAIPADRVGASRASRTRRRAGLVVVAVLAATASVVGATAAPVAAARRCGRSDLANYTVGDGDSWFVIARAVDVGMQRLLDANGASDRSAIHPGDVLCLPPGADTTVSAGASCNAYVVGDGDSWFRISRAAGVSMSRLLGANGASADSAIHPGQQLCLPPGASATSSAASSSSASSSTSSRAAAQQGVNGLVAFPIQGPCWFGDTWNAARGNGRRHEGVDLIAEQGKYVYAVTAGTLTKRAWDQPGLRAGNAWWLTAADGSGTYYFYAHLYAFAPGLKVGSTVRAGEIIGFVGTTGNSATPHLHFEMHPRGGGAVNPYATIRAMSGCTSGLVYAQPSGWTPEG